MAKLLLFSGALLAFSHSVSLNADDEKTITLSASDLQAVYEEYRDTMQENDKLRDVIAHMATRVIELEASKNCS